MAISLNTVNSEVVRAHTRIDEIVGLGQKGYSWKNVLKSRNLDTYYTNSTKGPIAVTVSMNETHDTSTYIAVVNDTYITQMNNGSSMCSNLFFIVPEGSKYKIIAGGPKDRIVIWVEFTL